MTALPTLAVLVAAAAVLLALHDQPPRRSAAPVRVSGRHRNRGRPVTPGRSSVPLRPGPAGPGGPAMLLTAATTLAGVLTVGPLPMLLVPGGVGLVLSRMARARRRHRAREVDDAAVDLIDLFGIALASGQPVPTALITVAERAPAPVRDPLGRSAHRLRHGLSVEAVLTELDELGPAHRPLLQILRTAHLDGTPVLAALDRIAETARDRRRRNSEARVRRLPVTMLFPLVVCILPAFGILTVVPLLVVSLTDLA